jgi:DNA helicase INO80
MQMTTMMDLLEELFAYRRHRWLRLDGSTPIAERRDLVDAWQGSDAYFVFLLSTRAGGLGINLTAADTVIFYESDWNPTMDLQVGGAAAANMDHDCSAVCSLTRRPRFATGQSSYM